MANLANDSYSDQQLILAARLYYVDGMSQTEVGALVHVSQSKISRMLALAKERGLVQITVPEYEWRNAEIEAALKKAFSIRAVVIHSISGVKGHSLRQLAGYFAARIVRDWFRSGDLVLLAGGRTIQVMVSQMQPKSETQRLRFAQGMGHVDATPGACDAAEVCRVMAEKWRGSVVGLNAPLLFPDRDSCQRFTRLPQIRNALKLEAAADMTIVGVGTLEDSLLMERSIFSHADITELRAAEAIGEMLGRFYTVRGIECRTSVRARTLSLDLDKMKEIPRRVGLAVGAEKAHALLAALRGGLLNTIITDESCAAEVLQGTSA